MSAPQPPEAAVEAAAEAIWNHRPMSREYDGSPKPWPTLKKYQRDRYRGMARAAIAAAEPYIRREAGREGYRTARDDIMSGAFIGGPNYDAFKATFAGRKMRREWLEGLIAKYEAEAERNQRGFIPRVFDGTPMPDISDAAGAARRLRAELAEGGDGE